MECVKDKKLEREVFWARPGNPEEGKQESDTGLMEGEGLEIDENNAVVSVTSDGEEFNMDNQNLTKVIYLEEGYNRTEVVLEIISARMNVSNILIYHVERESF